jgi:hypothetical protein
MSVASKILQPSQGFPDKPSTAPLTAATFMAEEQVALGTGKDHMRIKYFVYGAALLAGALAFCGPDRAGAQSAEQACTPDAMRLCAQFIPDRARVTTCMMANRAQLSEPCRLAMGGGGKRPAVRAARGARAASATRHHYAHCGKHSKHC